MKRHFIFEGSPYTLFIYKGRGVAASSYRILSSERTNASSFLMP